MTYFMINVAWCKERFCVVFWMIAAIINAVVNSVPAHAAGTESFGDMTTRLAAQCTIRTLPPTDSSKDVPPMTLCA